MKKQTACIVAIAKNEGRYLEEWVMYHLAIGLDRIVVYDHESDDETSSLLHNLSRSLPVERILWETPGGGQSPQRSAYNDAARRIRDMEWGVFIDIDEFIVPWGYDDFPAFVRNIPQDAGSVSINWRCFGSSGLQTPDYESVVRAFTRCGPASWGNNRHVKTMARFAAIKEVRIHDVSVKWGEQLDARFDPLELVEPGRTAEPYYDGIQINHYQSKTYPEFFARMARGNANFPAGHPRHERSNGPDRFRQVDRNEEIDLRIEPFAERMERFALNWHRGQKRG